MKTFATTLLVAAGLAFGAGAASAAPVGAPGSGLPVQGLFTPAQYYGGGGGYGGGYGYRYRPQCHYVRRCSGYYPYQRCWNERVCH